MSFSYHVKINRPLCPLESHTNWRLGEGVLTYSGKRTQVHNATLGKLFAVDNLFEPCKIQLVSSNIEKHYAGAVFSVYFWYYRYRKASMKGGKTRRTRNDNEVDYMLQLHGINFINRGQRTDLTSHWNIKFINSVGRTRTLLLLDTKISNLEMIFLFDVGQQIE